MSAKERNIARRELFEANGLTARNGDLVRMKDLTKYQDEVKDKSSEKIREELGMVGSNVQDQLTSMKLKDAARDKRQKKERVTGKELEDETGIVDAMKDQQALGMSTEDLLTVMNGRDAGTDAYKGAEDMLRRQQQQQASGMNTAGIAGTIIELLRRVAHNTVSGGDK